MPVEAILVLFEHGLGVCLKAVLNIRSTSTARKDDWEDRTQPHVASTYGILARGLVIRIKVRAIFSTDDLTNDLAVWRPRLQLRSSHPNR